MNRREILRASGLAAVAAGLAACSAPDGKIPTSSGPRQQWKMITSWPRDFPGLGTAASTLGALIGEASGGRLTVKVYGAGELVPAFEVFDAVGRGVAEMGHSAAYYWKGKAAAAPFFCAVPFGLNAQEMNAWLYHGGGLELWRELYAPFNLLPFPAGNTGVQMAGWFNREIRSVRDLAGLKIRIPGIGGEVMARLGATPVNLPGAEIFTALQSGAIDATEWVGPWNDLAFGLHTVAKHYYYPGWQEPGPTLECMINKTAFEALPEDLQTLVSACCRAVNEAMLAEFTARNQDALDTLIREHGVDVRPLPADVLSALRRASEQTLEALATSDAMARRCYDSMRAFRAKAQAWHRISEESFYQARG